MHQHPRKSQNTVNSLSVSEFLLIWYSGVSILIKHPLLTAGSSLYDLLVLLMNLWLSLILNIGSAHGRLD